jgi:hypothetical protein
LTEGGRIGLGVGSESLATHCAPATQRGVARPIPHAEGEENVGRTDDSRGERAHALDLRWKVGGRKLA